MAETKSQAGLRFQGNTDVVLGLSAVSITRAQTESTGAAPAL
jgi:hypothetical protein